MIRLLVALYPRKWRATFGEEFAALLEDTRLTPRAVFDVVVSAGKLHAASHRRLALVLASLLWSGCMVYLSVRARLTANVLWAPTTPARALALAATMGPWLGFAVVTAARRLGHGPGNAHGGTAR
ncbi:MAG TPA: hypothetical protein VEG33_01430 [Streptosporangiaceae bacterium]|nr:hypothetical protein [Streptosporangiaceae bacterium]